MYCASYMENLECNDEKCLNQDEIERKIKEHVGYLVEIKSMKFMQIITPGDSMKIEVVMKNKFANFSLIEARVTVDGKVVATGKITVSEKG